MANAQSSAPQRQHERWFAAIGALLIVLGVIAGTVSTVFQLAAAVVLAVLLMASGFIQLGLALLSPAWRGAALHLTAAAADVVIGFLLLANIGDAVPGTDWLLFLFLAIGGLHRVIRSIWLRPAAWQWMFGTGILALCLAFCLRLNVLYRDVWLVGGYLAIDFIMHGVTWIVFSRATVPPASVIPPIVIEMPAFADWPAGQAATDTTEPHVDRSPFDKDDRMMAAEFEQLRANEERLQEPLEKLQQDIDRAKRANKDVL